MYYEEINEFIEKLDSTNIENLKPQLEKYVKQLILSIKDEDNNLSLDDLNSMMDIFLMRESVSNEIEEELEKENSKFGLLTDEFINIYNQFTEEMIQNGYLHDAIILTSNVSKSLDCIHRHILVIDKHKASGGEISGYMQSREYLIGLQEQISLHLNQYIKNLSREYLIISGLIDSIKLKLNEEIEESGKIILFELKNKSLEDFNKEEHLEEYKQHMSKDYILELQRRLYSWKVLSSRLKEPYFYEILYKDYE